MEICQIRLVWVRFTLHDERPLAYAKKIANVRKRSSLALKARIETYDHHLADGIILAHLLFFSARKSQKPKEIFWRCRVMMFKLWSLITDPECAKPDSLVMMLLAQSSLPLSVVLATREW
jgi:hypothetical protein